MSITKTLAAAASNGNEIINRQLTAKLGGLLPENRTITRRWKAVAAAELIGVSRQTLINAEKDGRIEPQDVDDSGRTPVKMGYTIYQIDEIRRKLGKTPPPLARAVTKAVANQKGGSGKTVTIAHLAQMTAMNGYRTLIIDTDPQATLGIYFGMLRGINVAAEDTILPYMLGETDDLRYAIRPTQWPNLDIIPGHSDLQRVETELYQAADNGQLPHPAHMMLTAGLQDLSADYDIILIDTSPNLGNGTVNAICAADTIVTTAPAELFDYVSTNQYIEALEGTLQAFDLGGHEPNMRILCTNYKPQVGSQSPEILKMMRESWGGLVLENTLKHTSTIGRSQVEFRTVFEQDNTQRGTPSTWKAALDIWTPIYDEIMRELVLPYQQEQA